MRRFLVQCFVFVLILLSLLPAATPARANVDLAYFEVESSAARPTELIIQWGTETETDTAGFRIKRGTVDDPAQAQSIHDEQAQGSSISGHDYEYVDTGLTTGQVYFYWLVELTTGNQEEVLRSTSATPGGATATATPTTQAPTSTPTTQAPTATPTTRPPTSTPTTRPAAPAAANTAAPLVTPVATTPAQPAAVATTAPATASAPGNAPAPADTAAPPPASAPVGDAEAQEKETAAAATAQLAERGESQDASAQGATLAAPVGETAAPGEQTSAEPALDATAMPQAVAAAPQPTLDGAQAQLVRPTATPRPDDTADASENTDSLLLVIGAGSLCGATVLVLAVLFVWRRN